MEIAERSGEVPIFSLKTKYLSTFALIKCALAKKKGFQKLFDIERKF